MRILALGMLVLLLAGCSGGGGFVKLTPDADGTYPIHLTAQNTFDPARAEVPAGAVVQFMVDGGAHDVSDEDGKWSSGDGRPLDEQGFPTLLVAGESYAHQFNETGTFTIWCHKHHEERMLLVLRVV